MLAHQILGHLGRQFEENMGNRITAAVANGIVQSLGRFMEETLAAEARAAEEAAKAPKQKRMTKE